MVDVPTMHSHKGLFPVLMATDSLTHEIVRNESNKPRLCYLCKINNTKTKSGWKAYSRFHCKICQINLCIGERDCFKVFHMLLERRHIGRDHMTYRTSHVTDSNVEKPYDEFKSITGLEDALNYEPYQPMVKDNEKL